MGFSHLDSTGNPNMVDVSGKTATLRKAKARAEVLLNADIIQHMVSGDIQTKKGSVFQTAIIGGIMAAKKTGDLIPLCHPIGMDDCHIDIRLEEGHKVIIECETKVFAKTGIEMEALVGANMAALVIYDMCKAFSHDITISSVQLISKSGGKRDFQR